MTQLEREARETADGARRQIAACADTLRAIGERLRAKPPAVVVTCARGSSDHAATYGKYLIETMLGRVVASVGPSVASMYERSLVLDGALFIAVSQSGRSPDLLRLTRAARDGGAFAIGMINAEGSPLAELCDVVLPLCAGEERSVAATKSYLLACLAFLQLVAAWSDDAALNEAVLAAPDAFARQQPFDLPIAAATNVYVLGRGVGLGAAQEIALKLIETCQLHAQAFSMAEVRHGPVALVGPGFPILAFAQDDETAASTRETIARLEKLGATVLSPSVDAPAVLAPLCQVLRCYLGLPALAAARGLDVDSPPHLNKVTETR